MGYGKLFSHVGGWEAGCDRERAISIIHLYNSEIWLCKVVLIMSLLHSFLFAVSQFSLFIRR